MVATAASSKEHTSGTVEMPTVDGCDGRRIPLTNSANVGACTPSTMSITAHTTNTTIFEEREGHSLEFEHVTLTASTPCSILPKKGTQATKQILHDVSGHVPARQVTALMGPSGSGKSSLLKVLTGRIGKKSKSLNLSGQVHLDGEIIDPTSIEVRREIAYVEQEVSIPTTATPREAIWFSARLRLERNLSDDAIDALVDEILCELNLEKCADTMIGGGLLMGATLSGGERKRAQCGVELVTRPGILVCDEATTGLDSFSAEQFVSSLQRIANSGASVLLTIHQPPPSVVRKLDHLILLRSGRLVYDGAMKDSVGKFSASKGYPKPSDFNISDWILNVIQSQSIDQLQSAGFFQSDAIGADDKSQRQSKRIADDATSTASTPTERAKWNTQMKLLLWREFQHLLRAKGSFVIRIGTTIFFGLLYGIIYHGIGNSDYSSQINVSSTFGAIAVTLVTTISGVAQSSLIDFPRDRPAFLREYSTNHYGALPYFIAHFCFECILTFLQTLVQVLTSYFLMSLRIHFLLFWSINFVLAIGVTSFGTLLGSVVDNPDVAVQLMPALVVPQMLFSGFFISTEMIPSFLRWIQYLCALTYAMRLALFYEFDDCESDACVETLERNGVFELKTIWYWMVLLMITVCFRTASMVALRSKANFQ